MLMAMDYVLVHYHEVALKKGNRPYFVRLLKENIASSVKGLKLQSIQSLAGRLLLAFDDLKEREEVCQRISSVFGIANFSFAQRVPPDLELLKSSIIESIGSRSFDSFRVQTKRGDKTFPLPSPEINRQVGGAIRQKTGSRVDLKNAEFTVSIEILPNDAFYGFDRFPGPGGLPVGASGRVLTLISGGIDSPVAAYRMLKRGCRVIFVHFHSYPFLDKTSQEKAEELVKILTRHQFVSRLYLVPFGEIQRQIVAGILRPLRVILYRRMMLRIGEAIARRARTTALVTGESLGQVASQTLQNLAVIEQAATLPILRPLVGMDKQEIIDQARAIRTFETSSLPDQDCCQFFIPAHPATKATLREVEEAESRLDLPALIALGTEKAEVREFKFP